MMGIYCLCVLGAIVGTAVSLSPHFRNNFDGREFVDQRLTHLSDEALWRQYETFSTSCGSADSVDNFTILQNLRKSWEDIQTKDMPGVQFGLSCWSTFSRNEFERTLVVEVPSERPPGGQPFIFPRASIPTSFDWRDVGAVSAVANQGHCGSCWAFAAAGALEGAIKRKFGALISLSEQNLMDCSPRAHGCEGGWMTHAYEYVQSNNGLNNDASYPYVGSEGNCMFESEEKVNLQVSGFQYTVAGDETDLLLALLNMGPIASAINARQMQSYQSGVFSCDSGLPNHGILIVGYGEDSSSGQKYWTVKNSWGASWGESGYIRIARDEDNSCGIASNANFPLVL